MLRSFGVYIGSSLINASIPFLMLPIFTRYLTTEDYGIVSMFSILCGFIMPLIAFSSTGILSREFFNQSKVEFSKYVGNIFFIFFLSLIPITISLLIFSSDIAQLSEVSENVIWLVLIFSFFSFFFNTCLMILQVQSKAKQYGIFQIGQTILNVTLTLILVVALNLGWEGRILAQVLAVVSFGSLGLYFMNKKGYINLVFDKAYIIDSLKFGIPLIPHTLGAIIISMSDRFFITKMVGLEATGLYAVGYSIGNIIGFIEHSFNLAFVPWLFEKLSLNDSSVKKKIVKFTYIYFLLILLLVLILTVSVPWIFRVFIDKKFEGSQVFVFWIALSFAFSGMYKMVTNYIFYVKKTQLLAWVTFGSALLNIVLNYFLINIFGAVGAAISAAIVSFCFFVFTWILSNKVYEMPWGIWNLLKKKI